MKKFMTILIIACFATQAYSQGVLWLEYNFDEGGGTTITDTSGFGANGTLVDTVTLLPSDGLGGSGCLEVNPDLATTEVGTGHVEIDMGTAHGTGDSAGPSLEGSFTVAAWIQNYGYDNTDGSPGNNNIAVILSHAGGGESYGSSMIIDNNWTASSDLGPWALQTMDLGPSPQQPKSDLTVPADGQWHFCAVVWDNTEVRFKMDDQTFATTTSGGAGSTGPIWTIGFRSATTPAGGEWGKYPFTGKIDNLRFWQGGGHSFEELEAIRQADMVSENAISPKPSDGAEDVRTTLAELTWKPGQSANMHDVYFGTAFSDVNDATPTNDPAGVYVGRQNATSYSPDRLDFGLTYYWRIDEVGSAVFKGDVWSFATEPYALPVENITATASSSDQGVDPENTVDGSGLNENDEHSKDEAAMWLSAADGPEPAWIQFEFDRVYKLHEMLVWNYNVAFEEILGFGVKEVSVEYSENGVGWAALGDVEFTQGPGQDGYASNTTVDLGGAAAHVRLTAKSNWSGTQPQSGLSEVRFLYVPVQAREPDPDSGSSDVDVDVILGWRAGRGAASHNVYVGSDPDALPLDGSVAEPSFDTASLGLALGQDYYWRVDEANDAETPTTWQGDLWSFSTKESLTVDGFESYNDIEAGQEGSNLIYLTWTDGFENPSANGSTIGYVTGTSLETAIVHGGNQCVPLTYNNSAASVSDVTVDPANLPIGRDWTKGAAETLVLWFYGQSGNAVTEKMYVNVGGVKVPYPGDAADVARPIWKQWNVNLAALGIDLSNVAQLGISFERTGATGGAGTVFIDDILLYRSAPAMASEEIWLEAEAGTLTAPMNAYSALPGASGGQYIGAELGNNSTGNPPAPAGTATYSITVQGGIYKLLCRVIAPSSGEDSLWIRIQGATTNTSNHSSGWIRWNDMVHGTDWQWDEVHSSDDSNETVYFTMPAGTYTLEVGYREDGAYVDALLLTDKP